MSVLVVVMLGIRDISDRFKHFVFQIWSSLSAAHGTLECNGEGQGKASFKNQITCCLLTKKMSPPFKKNDPTYNHRDCVSVFLPLKFSTHTHEWNKKKSLAGDLLRGRNFLPIILFNCPFSNFTLGSPLGNELLLPVGIYKYSEHVT